MLGPGVGRILRRHPGTLVLVLSPPVSAVGTCDYEEIPLSRSHCIMWARDLAVVTQVAIELTWEG